MAKNRLSKSFGMFVARRVKKNRRGRGHGWQGNFGHRGHGLFSSMKNPYNY